MNLHFILGGPGTGKSTLLLQRLIDSALARPHQRHVILVPEQFTLQTQRDVVERHPGHAVMNIDILSFERLAHRVLEETGQNRFRILTDMGKNMLLRRAAGAHRDELAVFGKSLGKYGFVGRLMDMISELYQYGVSAEELDETAAGLGDQPLLAAKLRDLSVFYRALNETRGEDTIAAEELLSLLNRTLAGSDFLSGAVVAMDHFTGFTPVQYEILGKMLRQAESVDVALTLPEEEIGDGSARPGELFYLSKTVVTRLTALAGEAGVPVEGEVCREDVRHAGSPSLRYLGRHFMRMGERETPPRESPEIRVTMARSPREESAFAASAVSRLVREEGIRYREIAVIAGDLSEYRPYLMSAFRREKIPVFMDRKTGLSGNPVVEYLRSALAVPEKDFSYETVMRHLKCGIGPLEREDLDELDNYVLACGIRGRKMWLEPFERTGDPKRPADLVRLNAAREAVCADLEPLLRCRREKRTKTAERTAALREMLQNSGAAEKAQEIAERCAQDGDRALAEEYGRVCDFLLDLLGQMDELMGEENLSWQEFSDLLDAGLDGARLGILPTGLDLVQIGDVRRSRLDNVRVVFILGLNDGLIPGAPAAGGILSEWEREILLDRKLNLAPTAQETSEQEIFSLYTLLTKPSERLFLSCSKMGSDGNARRPSYLLTQILGLFPALSPADAQETDWREKITGADSAWEVFAQTVGGESVPLAEPAYREFVRDLAAFPDPGRFGRILDAAYRVYRGENLSAETAQALYGPELTGSVTRLEEYASCACAQFFSYGLKLQPRSENVFTGADRGTFFHRAFERFFRLLLERGIDRRSLGEEERQALTEEAVEAAFGDEGMEPLRETAGGEQMAERWRRLAEQSIEVLCRQLDTGQFEPGALELPFDGRSLPAMNFTFPDGGRMALRGVVDRLDLCEESGTLYVKIVDYKTGQVQLDLQEIACGRQLQLMVYLDAVLELLSQRFPEQKIVPAGVYYYTVKNPVFHWEKGADEEKREKNLRKELALRGLTDEETAERVGDAAGDRISSGQFQGLRRFVRKKAGQFGEEILNGRTEVSPYRRKGKTGCDYCPFSAVCGFDPRIPGYHFRTRPEQKKEELWHEIGEEKKGGDHGVDTGTEGGH